jgi:hypothetical protein
MSQAILNQIIDRLHELEISELEQLSQEIQIYLAEREYSTKKASFNRALLESGLIKQIKNPTFELRSQKQLIQVRGEAVSQTIIEERR